MKPTELKRMAWRRYYWTRKAKDSGYKINARKRIVFASYDDSSNILKNLCKNGIQVQYEIT